MATRLTDGEGASRSKPKAKPKTGIGQANSLRAQQLKPKAASSKSLVGNLGRTPKPKAGGGIDLGKFASEVSTNFARGVARATAPRSGPGAGIGLGGIQSPGIKRASGKGGASNNAYLNKALGTKRR